MRWSVDFGYLFPSLTEFFGKMIPSCEVNANPVIKQRVLSLLGLLKNHCWFLMFLNTKRAVISNKRSRPFFFFFNLIGWLMTSDWQLVNRTSLSYFFHETYVGSFDQYKFIPNWLFFQAGGTRKDTQMIDCASPN